MVDWENIDFDSPPLLQDITSETIAIMNKLFYLIIRVIHNMWREISKMFLQFVAKFTDMIHARALIQIKKSRVDLLKVETKAVVLH